MLQFFSSWITNSRNAVERENCISKVNCCADSIYHLFLCVGDCYTPLSQGPCQEGEWLIMKKGGEEGVCSKTPCDSPIQVKYCEQRLIQEAEQKRQNVSISVSEGWRMHIWRGPS